MNRQTENPTTRGKSHGKQSTTNVLLAPLHLVAGWDFGSEEQLASDLVSRIANVHDVQFDAICGWQTGSFPNDVAVHSCFPSDPDTDIGVFKKLWFYVRCHQEAAQLVNERNPDIIHHMGPFRFGRTFNFVDVLSKSRPLVLGPVQIPQTYVGDDEYGGLNSPYNEGESTRFDIDDTVLRFADPVLRRLFSRTVERADRIIAVNEHAKEMYSRYTSKKKITVVHNGVDLNRFTYNFPTNERKEILFVGKLVRRKNVSDLIRATERIVEEFPTVRLRIVGDGPMRNSLEQLSEECGLATNVRFEGYVADELLPTYYEQADVYVLPSCSESYGLVLLEAMASGTPCIAYDIPGPDEVITDGKTGYLCERGNSRQLGERVRSLLADEATRLEMSQNARRRAHAHDIDTIATKIATVYHEVR